MQRANFQQCKMGFPCETGYAGMEGVQIYRRYDKSLSTEVYKPKNQVNRLYNEKYIKWLELYNKTTPELVT